MNSTGNVLSVRRIAIRAAVPLYLGAIFGLPLLLVAFVVTAAPVPSVRVLALLSAPLVYATAMAITAGTLSRIAVSGIQPGRFPRDLGHSIYGPRRLHALCWTAVYYSGPIYHALIAVPATRRLLFRLFGYRGALDITLYPDTWIRDLPLLNIGSEAYLSNRCTIGTNMCLADGTVLVEGINIGRRAMVGHLAMLAPGVSIGDGAAVGIGSAVGVMAHIGHNVDIGYGVAIGARAKIGARTRVGPRALITQGVRIGSDCVIGAGCRIGERARIADGVVLPFGTDVPPGAVVELPVPAVAGRSSGSKRAE